MSCRTFNQTITRPCKSTPGVSELYIANYDDIISVTDNGSLVTAISGATASGATSGFFYNVKVNPETASFTDELISDYKAGSYIYKHGVTFVISSLDEASRSIFYSMSQANLVIVVKTRDGNYYLLGKDNGLFSVDTAKATTGVASGDMRGLEITISGLEPEPYIEIDTTSYTIADDVVA